MHIELSVPDGPERRTTAFVQNMFNFIVYINWLLALYAQSKPPCLLRYSLTQLQRALAGDHRSGRSSEHVQVVNMSYPSCLQIPNPQGARGRRLCCGFAQCLVLPD